MVLKFFGNGTGSSFNHTNAYFEVEEKLYLIDCSMLNIIKILSLANNYKDIYIFITHMHYDHCSGIAMLVQMLYLKKKVKVNICSPNYLVKDIEEFVKIQDSTKEQYNIIEINKDFVNISNKVRVKSIKTTHAPNYLSCGYVIEIEKSLIIYTGDTNSIHKFIEIAKEASNYDLIELYSEMYLEDYKGDNPQHTSFAQVEDLLLSLPKDINIYFIHIDDPDGLKKYISNLERHYEVVEII